MAEKLIHITAYSRPNEKRVDLYYVSVKQAAYFNPELKDFRAEGVLE